MQTPARLPRACSMWHNPHRCFGKRGHVVTYLCVRLEHTPIKVVRDLSTVLHLRHHVLEGRPTASERCNQRRRTRFDYKGDRQQFGQSCCSPLKPVVRLRSPLINFSFAAVANGMSCAPNGPVVEMLLQEEDAGREIAVVVLVRNAPPKGTELSSLLHLRRKPAPRSSRTMHASRSISRINSPSLKWRNKHIMRRKPQSTALILGSSCLTARTTSV